jgi:glucose/arabinose dehydrogenase
VVAAAGAQTPLKMRRVATGLGSLPTDITAPAGDFGRLFVAEKNGAIRIVKNGVVVPTAFLDLSSSVIWTNGEQGLLGLAFHPSYATNGFFYVYYTRQPDGGLTIARYRVSANPDLADPTSAMAVITIPRPAGVFNHNGGALEFGPDGYLYFATGDGGEWTCMAQNNQSLLGKLCRIDVDGGVPYAIPPSNPFVGHPLFRPEIWAYGLRNPWRITFDRLTGDLYIADVGGSEQEEIDFQPPGAGGRNYGWTVMEGTDCVEFGPCPVTAPPCGDPSLTPPIWTYPHTNGNNTIIGGYVYRGCAIPDLRGSYFFADWATGHIWSLRHANGVVTEVIDRSAELVSPSGQPLTFLTTFGEDAQGELYVGDQRNEIHKIEPVTPVLTGVTAYGSGTAGCRGAHTLTASCSPTLPNAGWTLVCGNAPLNAVGLGLIGTAPDVAGTVALGVRFHVNLAGVVIPVSFLSSDSGVGAFTLGLPPDPALVGLFFFAQVVWPWSGSCSLPPLGLSGSNGVMVTIQP